MEVDLRGKTAIVTGSTTGIGREIARTLAQNGAAVVINSNTEEGSEFAGEINDGGGRAVFIRADVSNRADTQRLADETARHFGGIDILVNNAGINIPMRLRGPIFEFPDDMWDKIMHVDLDGVYNCSKAALRYMLASGGRIINIASVVGLVPLRNQCAFAAAKAGVIQLSKAMAIELAEHGITVNAICPGSIQIPIMETEGMYADGRFESIISHIPQKRPGAPEDVASLALFLASQEAGYITGVAHVVDGGWTSGFARDW